MKARICEGLPMAEKHHQHEQRHQHRNHREQLIRAFRYPAARPRYQTANYSIRLCLMLQRRRGRRSPAINTHHDPNPHHDEKDSP